ncbi:MAG: hypothetical protein ACKOFH_03015, partial [Chthoniobacterales bacterium]
QHEWLCAGDGTILVDRIVTYERLDTELPDVFRTLGLPSGTMPRVNVSTWHKPAASPAVVGFVESYYRRDYELFGYPTAR